MKEGTIIVIEILREFKTIFIKNNEVNEIICNEPLNQNMMDISTVKDLADKIYYKISKSSSDIKSFCSESHYIEYQENSIIKDKGSHYICFVPAEYVVLCIHYGAQLTEIKFDSTDCRFDEIASEEAKFGGMIWHEFNARAVMTGRNYSLSEPETLQMIVDMALPDNLVKAVLMEETEKLSISNHLKKLGFEETLSLWEEIQNNVNLRLNIKKRY